MEVPESLRAHGAETGKRPPLPSASCHLNLSGKHSAADLKGTERKCDRGTARQLGRLGRWTQGERLLYPRPKDCARNVESGLCFLEGNLYLFFALGIDLSGGRRRDHVPFVNFDSRNLH